MRHLTSGRERSFAKVPVARIAKEVFYIPTIALLFVVVMLQGRGQAKPAL